MTKEEMTPNIHLVRICVTLLELEIKYIHHTLMKTFLVERILEHLYKIQKGQTSILRKLNLEKDKSQQINVGVGESICKLAVSI